MVLWPLTSRVVRGVQYWARLVTKLITTYKIFSCYNKDKKKMNRSCIFFIGFYAVVTTCYNSIITNVLFICY